MNEQTSLCSEIIFKAIFESHYKLLRNYLLYRFKDFERAEDAAQNAFVILWENCDKLKPEQAKSFLFTTAIRQSLNVIKHDKVVSDFQLQYKPKSTHVESPEFIIVSDELRIQLENAIQNLPEKQRVVFMLNRFENQTYREIADAMDLSVKAVEKRMHLALLSLRDVLPNI